MAQIQASRIRFICSRHVFFGNSVELIEKFIFPRRSKRLNFFPPVFSSFFFLPKSHTTMFASFSFCLHAFFPTSFPHSSFGVLFDGLLGKLLHGSLRGAIFHGEKWFGKRLYQGKCIKKCSKVLFKRRTSQIMPFTFFWAPERRLKSEYLLEL